MTSQLPDFDALLLAQAAEQAAIREHPAPVCDEHNCREAYSSADVCKCRCEGAGHGLRWREEAARGRAAMAARTERAGGAFALLPQVDDDAW